MDIIRGTSNLEWHMLRPPCRNCAELIIKNRSFYKNLTILLRLALEVMEQMTI